MKHTNFTAESYLPYKRAAASYEEIVTDIATNRRDSSNHLGSLEVTAL